MWRKKIQKSLYKYMYSNSQCFQYIKLNKKFFFIYSKKKKKGHFITKNGLIDWFIVLNATFSNISAISLWTVLVVEEVGVHRENRRPCASNWYSPFDFYQCSEKKILKVQFSNQHLFSRCLLIYDIYTSSDN